MIDRVTIQPGVWTALSASAPSSFCEVMPMDGDIHIVISETAPSNSLDGGYKLTQFAMDRRGDLGAMRMFARPASISPVSIYRKAV